MHIIAVRTAQLRRMLVHHCLGDYSLLLLCVLVLVVIIGSVQEGWLLLWVRTIQVKRLGLLIAYRVRP